MSERFVEVPGGRLAVHDFGSGPAIVLLHASIVDAWAWEPLTPYLLDAGYRVVAFDRRGSGASVTEDVAFSNRADVIAVLDALGIGRACLVGNSIGGMVALDTSIEYPERVVALVTIGAGVAGWEVEPTPEEAALFEEMDRLEESGEPEAVADFDVRTWVDGPGQPEDRVPDEIRELVREMALRVARDQRDPEHHSGRPIRLTPPAAQQLDRLTMPVLAIAGALDVSDVAACARHARGAGAHRAGVDHARRRPHDRPRSARCAGPRHPGPRGAAGTLVSAPRKPRDVGNGLVCASFGRGGEWLSLATVDPEAGFVELTGLPVFDPELRGNAEAVLRYRSWMRREDHAFLRVEAGRATITTREDAPRGTRAVVQRLVIRASRRDRPAGIRIRVSGRLARPAAGRSTRDGAAGR